MPRPTTTLTLFLLLLLANPLDAQRRRRDKSDDAWPPERSYGRTTLGNALQDAFERHYDFCGFAKADGRRDYTPPTIERFLGRRSLRTRVESADINGGNLLSYIFLADETEVPLNEIRYRADRLLYNRADGVNLLPEPRPGFDAFVLTKNCAGYLKSALDGGLKPPYASFQAALETDGNRKSTVVAVAGSFLSPLAEILSANDTRTTELMARLWQFYQRHPEYANGARYLRQFDGVMLKHLTDAAEIMSSEQSLGVNVSLPLAGKLGVQGTRGRTTDAAFSGTDWETVVFTDFAGPYNRERLFARLPGPEEIQRYFATVPLARVTDRPAPLREAGSHNHTVRIPGLPAALASAGWRIEHLSGGTFRDDAPNLSVTPGEGGLTFTVSGYASPNLFTPRSISADIPMNYELVLPATGGFPALRIPVGQRFGLSNHPLVDLAGTRFELRRKNNGQYAFQWHLTLDVVDAENPIDPNGRSQISQLTAGYADNPLAIQVVETRYDPRRGALNVILESERTWPLANIDDRNMMSYPLEMEVCLPVRDGFSLCRRPVESRIAVPRIRVNVVERLGG